jgi:hypothetical protein
MNRRLLLSLTAAALLAACAEVPVTAIQTGETRVKGRLAVDVATPWNQFELGEFAKTPTWTNEGITLDALQFWVGIKDGELIAPTPSEPKGLKPLTFKSTMQVAEVVDLYQSLWTRDGSTFTVVRLEPTPFLEGNGFRLEYTRLRKVDDVLLQGVAWGAVRNGELFVISYSAPRLAFYSRYLPRAEAIAKSARVRG